MMLSKDRAPGLYGFLNLKSKMYGFLNLRSEMYGSHRKSETGNPLSCRPTGGLREADHLSRSDRPARSGPVRQDSFFSLYPPGNFFPL